jgi:hypothetical protein
VCCIEKLLENKNTKCVPDSLVWQEKKERRERGEREKEKRVVREKERERERERPGWSLGHSPSDDHFIFLCENSAPSVHI